MLKRAYVEITNVCNLHCAFCPGTRRRQRFMTAEEFAAIAEKLRGSVQYLYLHVMGEPLLHPALPQILAAAEQLGFRVCVTTNGTLLEKAGETLFGCRALHKVSVSLHSFEGNDGGDMRPYLESVWRFAEKLSQRDVIGALRLWNEGGAEERNGEVLAFLREKTGESAWEEKRDGSFTLRPKLYLEHAEKFEWPDLSAPESGTEFCLGLRDQIAVLVDGTVVPCCLDHEGDIPLGNLLEQDLADILGGERAKAIYEGFSCRRPTEELCRRCGYASRFNRG
ncbi:MAG: radical SAM protein [Oscillospiraceae bacterium]|nr:radical SAM protein [Oscillospiraceae bacterium]